jgi:hypothetical protein
MRQQCHILVDRSPKSSSVLGLAELDKTSRFSGVHRRCFSPCVNYARLCALYRETSLGLLCGVDLFLR